jgi:FeS assembly SUF system protein
MTVELTPIETEIIRNEIIEAMKTVYDPEIPVSIYELGLIYDVDVETDGTANIRMTLTSPGCPVAGTLPGEVESKARSESGATDVEVEVVWDPTWTMDMMSDGAKLELGLL